MPGARHTGEYLCYTQMQGLQRADHTEPEAMWCYFGGSPFEAQ